MKRKKAGFTLVELVTTLSILGIAVGMASAVIANLVRTQNASNEEYSYAKQIDDTRSLLNEFCSYVSMYSEDDSFAHPISFTFASINESKTSISFSYTVDESTYLYSLSYEDQSLKVLNNYVGDVDYLKYNKNISIPDIKNYQINYDDTLKMVKTTFSVNGRDYHHVAVVRSLL